MCVFLWFGYSHRASHCTAQPCRLQSATLQKNASIIWFHSRLSFCCSCLGVDAAGGWNPRTNLELLGELLLACLWGDLSHHHCFTKLKKKKLCSKTITSDLTWLISCHKTRRWRRKRESGGRQTDSFKKCLSPRCYTKPPLLIRLSRKRGRERWHKWLQESACTPLQDRILEVQQRRGVPSRKHKTGTTVLVLTSHLPGASSKSIDLTVSNS